jgi:hypothetical protein
MTKLFKLLRRGHPALGDMGPRSEDIARILGSMASAIDALQPLRNRASVAHPNLELLAAFGWGLRSGLVVASPIPGR